MESFCKSFSKKIYIYFHKTLFMGLLESASLRVEMPVEVTLPTTGSPQTARKRDPHWKLLLLLFWPKIFIKKFAQLD